jgi:DNA polymerase III subunit delta'
MPFRDIKGQCQALNIIKAGIESQRLEGGYLFTGPDSIGKKMAAVAFSQAVNCLFLSKLDACAECPSCKKIAKNQHPDVRLFSEETGSIKIEIIRDMQKWISLKPYEGKFKVFIIDNAHMLTPEASNCLLKVLEEPPKSSLVMLITDRPNMLLKTIISRCRVVKFKPYNREDLTRELEGSYSMDHSIAHFLAYFSEGRLGEALRLKKDKIMEERRAVIDKLKTPNSFNGITAMIDSKEAFLFILKVFSSWFRDLYFLKHGLPTNKVINYDYTEELLNSSRELSILNIDKVLTTIYDAAFYSQYSINPRLLILNLKAQIWVR